jgi:hypothetical protein
MLWCWPKLILICFKAVCLQDNFRDHPLNSQRLMVAIYVRINGDCFSRDGELTICFFWEPFSCTRMRGSPSSLCLFEGQQQRLLARFSSILWLLPTSILSTIPNNPKFCPKFLQIFLVKYVNFLHFSSEKVKTLAEALGLGSLHRTFRSGDAKPPRCRRGFPGVPRGWFPVFPGGLLSSLDH